jgi:hypothetical protein
MKKNKLMCRIILNLKIRRMKERSIHLQEVKKEILGVQRPIPYPQEVIKSQDNARFKRFIELLKNLCWQVPLVDALKMHPYSKYMKDIVTNKRKIPSEAITTILAGYSFEEKMPEKRGDPRIPTTPCTINNNYVKYYLCDLGAGVSVMPFYLYKKLNLDNLCKLKFLYKWLISLLLFQLVYVKMFLLWLLM